MDFILHPAEVRVLGSLLEKDITTPEYYPLTLNALVAACNQKSNRDPVLTYEDEAVIRALESLRAKGFSSVVTGGGNRVPKYSHRISDKLNLGRRELAVMCELMVRGPQTPGELKNRGARMYDFSDVEEVETVLHGLAERTPDPLAIRLQHVPGTKEPRWAHLLSGEPVLPVAGASHAPAMMPMSQGSQVDHRIDNLEAEVAALREELHEMKRQMEDFRRQFE